ncbi:Diphthine_synthase [Hexamita inflata]|uniref:diphthine methyl ester synthase n=1 Tax=Hexamita inflata TaxID=28002 RepID=A0AA86U4T4_9EUKA|nr:Diphthine synthase [Hexamita inflata]
MPLYLIGLGLTPDSISLKAINIIKNCSKVFLDAYTSILVSYEEMTKLMTEVLNRNDLIQADRTLVERDAGQILNPAKDSDVAFLVVGDALCATTHSDLYLRAVQEGIQVKVLHNASIINAVAGTGLEIYKFGRTISVPFFEEKWKPVSFITKTIENFQMGMHSLLLMDIKTKELDWKLYMRGIERYQNPRYMSCAVCCQQFVDVLNTENDEDLSVETKQDFEEIRIHAAKAGFSVDSKCVACMRVGTDDQKFIYCSIGEMAKLAEHMGAPLHSLVVLGNIVSDMEQEMLNLWKL